MAIHRFDTTHHSSRTAVPFLIWPSRNDVARLLHAPFVADTYSGYCGRGAKLLYLPKDLGSADAAVYPARLPSEVESSGVGVG